jgi:hypothetical protein
VDDPVTQYAPTARPGHRAPHVWLTRGGARISTIDLFGPRFVVLTGPDGAPWREAAQRIATPARPALVAHTVGGDGDLGDPDGAWLAAYGLDRDGAVLVRPDGHVAWRSCTGSADAEGTLTAALDTVLGRAAKSVAAPR